MVNVSVGILQGRDVISAELMSAFAGAQGKVYAPGKYRFSDPVTLVPDDPGTCAFALEDVTIGIGFHWERSERQVFRGALRIVRHDGRLTAINDVPLEEYVTSVISSEMSASCPVELLKAHAVIARSWLKGPLPPSGGQMERAGEIVRWYGRESHDAFEVCADDHCQRYQGITKTFSPSAADAVRATETEFLFHGDDICDARFSKCCGGISENYSTAWDDRQVPYLTSVCDGPEPPLFSDPEEWIRSEPPAYCNTKDSALIAQILPGFDRETRDFYRWKVEYTAEDLREIVKLRLHIDLGDIRELKPLARGPSARIYRLHIAGSKASITIGKELEIRRALSRSHLYSSAFVVDREDDRFVLRGAGWGHGVGLCQIGAAVMASQGKRYREILAHYYPHTRTGTANVLAADYTDGAQNSL